MISAYCTRCGVESSAAANAWAVVQVTTSAGTFRRVESVCDQCGSGVATYIDEPEAHAISALVQARPDIEQLRVNYLCEAILDREGLT